MALRALVKCSNIFFIVFLMCPKRSRLTAEAPNDVNDPDTKTIPSKLSTDIIIHKEGESLTAIDDEPGFDLSDDEIRKFKLWPKGVIPYYIDALSFSDKVLRDRIRLFLNVVNRETRLNFMEMPSPPKDEKTRWVFFVNRRGQLGCADHSILNFTNEGVQQVVLGYDCIFTGGEIAEAVLSIAGVPPQHNAPDRDDYIKVIEENIIPEKRYLFQKLNDDQWLFYNLKYDFSSAGHFHYHKHSIRGRATIEAQEPFTGISMGETKGFTSSDVIKLRMLYNYIVKKDEGKVPECEQLFKRGRSFSNDTEPLTEPKPRKKPNRYLGLPEKEHVETNEHQKPESDNKIEKEHKSNEEDSDDTDNSEVPTTSKHNLKSQPKHRMVPKNIDPLTYLSDYQTGDEKRRRKGGLKKKF